MYQLWTYLRVVLLPSYKTTHDSDESNENSTRNNNSPMPTSPYAQTSNSTNDIFNRDEDDVHNYDIIIPLENMENIENNAELLSETNTSNELNIVDIQGTNCHTCCNKCRKLQNVLIKKLNMIINILTNLESNHVNTTDQFNLLSNFQLSIVEEFLQFEKELQTDKEIRKQFKNKIAKFGGNSFASKTRNILKFSLTDTLCQKLSWTGRKGSTAVKDTAFATIIIDYVSSVDQCSLHDVQKVIQEWLRHAGDRVQYELKKK